jgi:hypothetical protein
MSEEKKVMLPLADLPEVEVGFVYMVVCVNRNTGEIVLRPMYWDDLKEMYND